METFPIYNTSIKKMEEIRTAILKDKCVRRILRTSKTEENGRWLIEINKAKVTQAQQHIDNVLFSIENVEDENNAYRINLEFANDDMVKMSKGFKE